MFTVDSLAVLGRLLGFAFAAGINLYATVAILGLSVRYGWVALPPQYGVFDNPWIIGGAIALYLVEFVADKVPGVDSLWDVVHTIIRPLGGALIAVASIGQSQPALEAVAAIAGALLATSTHVTKAGTRVVANTSPEPFSNWGLSLTEDGIVVGVTVLALTHPVAAAIVVILALLAIGFAVRWLFQRIRRGLGDPERSS